MQIGAYEIERELGRGGFGVVYVGIDRRLGRRAAVKQLLPELSTRRDIVERFFNEAKAAASIDHPSIVEIYDVGWHSDGTAYFAMKLLEGESLGRRVRKGPLSIAHACTIARQVASALVATHAAGIVHRDLKPDNIVLVPDDEITIGERAVILDFGIAKLGSAGSMTQTRSGMMMGTPGYMSPEQCRGAGEVDHRTDIYALGCILFEMLTGRTPFVGEGPGEVMGMHQFVEAPLLRSLRPDAPAELEALISLLLAKKLDQRMQLISELPPALGPFATGGRVHVPSPAASAPLPAIQVAADARTAMSEYDVAPHAPTARSDRPEPPPHKTTLGATTGERVTPPPRSTRKWLGLGLGAGAIAVVAGIAIATRGSSDRTGDVAVPILDAAAPADANLEAARIFAECTALEHDRSWQALSRCADKLLPFDRAVARRWNTEAFGEGLAETNFKGLKDAATRLDLQAAEERFKQIPDGSVYHDEARALRDGIKPELIAREIVATNAIKADCGKWKAKIHELDKRFGADIARQVDSATSPCGTSIVATVPVVPPPTACGEATKRQLRAQGAAALADDRYGDAVLSFESLAICDPTAHDQAYFAACRAKKFAVAQRHFDALPAARKRLAARMCITEGYDPTSGTPPTTAKDVERVLATFTTKALECGARNVGRGKVEITLLLGPDGVRGAIANPPSEAAKCLELAIRSAKFPPWPSGTANFKRTFELSKPGN